MFAIFNRLDNRLAKDQFVAALNGDDEEDDEDVQKADIMDAQFNEYTDLNSSKQ